MGKTIEISGRKIGEGFPAYITGEIGINHNGDVNIAKKLIDRSKGMKFDAVKFQKRVPEKCVPKEQWDKIYVTPWGDVPYIEYRHKIEFGYEEYKEIDRHCKKNNITWFASCWDEESVDFMEKFNQPCYKVPSAALTDFGLLKKVRTTGKPIILSTGMSTMEQIHKAVDILGTDDILIVHTTSTYPCKIEELNLLMIKTLQKEFNCPIGYSGHEVGLSTTLAATVLGASYVERHITLDRAMWGSDQATSLESNGMRRLVRDIHLVEKALGDGVKRVYDSEIPIMKKLRRC